MNPRLETRVVVRIAALFNMANTRKVGGLMLEKKRRGKKKLEMKENREKWRECVCMFVCKVCLAGGNKQCFFSCINLEPDDWPNPTMLSCFGSGSSVSVYVL